MKKFKIDRNASIRMVALLESLLILGGSTFVSCSNKKNNDTNNDSETEVTDVLTTPQIEPETEAPVVEPTLTLEEQMVLSTNSNIMNLFPDMNSETVNNATLILLLDLLAKEDENGKISSDVISNFKARIDSDNMMSDFNAVLDVLENTMITENRFITMSTVLPQEEKEDIEILSSIESIVSTIQYLVQNNGSKDQIVTEYNKIHSLFVDEDSVLVNGKELRVRDLSYANRALASAYARTAGYYVRNYVPEKDLKRLVERNNEQNNKAYIKTKLEILGNQMNEVSKIDVIAAINDKYTLINNSILSKANLSSSSIENLVNYANLKYIASDNVATKDKREILDGYDDSKVDEAIMAIDTIFTYDINNQDSMLLFSDLLLDTYKESNSGEIDKIALDFVQYNSIMLLNTKDNIDIINNPYFQNIYKYFTKQDFTHMFKDENDEVKEVNVVWQDISDSTNFINNEIVLYTLNKLEMKKIEDMGYMKKAESNLVESIQYIQNTVSGECEKVDLEFVKVK